MKSQRQVGFIKTYSSTKHINYFQEEPSEFSYFRPRPNRHQDEQFSPYKVDDEIDFKKTAPSRPPIPAKQKQQTKPVVIQRKLKVEGEQIYNKIKERMNSYEERKMKSKQKLQENIGNIRNKIQKLDVALKQLQSQKSVQKRQSIQKKVKKEFQAQIDSSSEASSSSQSEEIVVKSIPSPKMSQQKLQQIQRLSQQNRRSIQKAQLQDEDKSIQRQQSLSKRQNIITFNSRMTNKPPLQIKDYTSSSQQEQQDHRNQRLKPQKRGPQFQQEQRQQDQRQKQTIMRTRNNEERQKHNHLFKNKGGVCFQIDTRQFTQPIPIPRQQRYPKKKPQKVDKKAQLLRRRQTAKAFDKKARRQLFAHYN